MLVFEVLSFAYHLHDPGVLVLHMCGLCGAVLSWGSGLVAVLARHSCATGGSAGVFWCQ